jgi:hypothetical protein
MGCCLSNSVDLKKIEVVIPITKQISSEFIDMSLSSDNEIPAKEYEEWKELKYSTIKSLNDSLGVMNALLLSERKISSHSRSGSIVDSFHVSLPVTTTH